MRVWIKTTIVEAFPYFYGHAEFKPGPKPGQDTMYGRPYGGPFYAPNSEWFALPKDKAFEEWRAAHLRDHGYTIKVERVER
jgi:hypothetical protein